MSLTEKQIAQQQDLVDNAIYNALWTIIGRSLPWDAELIGNVRDCVLAQLQEFHDLSPDALYPFFEEES